MFDGVSLDQLRTFIAAADEGSFSAAGRRLRRAQSVVSQTLANLEGQLGVKLFDRGARFPMLTDEGRALLADARAVAGNVDLFKARAKSLAGGLEPELSVAVDVVFPLAPFTAAVAAFQKEFPATLLRFDVESSAVIEPVLDGRRKCGVFPISEPSMNSCAQVLDLASCRSTSSGRTWRAARSFRSRSSPDRRRAT
jgi:DNA-binding transcriptional LysR family regulator